MSMTYIGRLVNNLKEFYTEINGATLTGAIDVVVVEQPDGSYTCSPFHVRFGKLGVLRSREKIVDIEINGESRDIHMKLGESGEAFFVEEVSDTETEEIPDHLATSPIPVSHFEELYNAQGRRRNSVDLGENNKQILLPGIENEVFTYSKRRYTADDDNPKTRGKDFITRQIQLGNIPSDSFSADDVSSTAVSSATNTNNQSCETFFPIDDVSPVVSSNVATDDQKANVPSSQTTTSDEAAKDGALQKASSSTTRRRRRKKSIMNGKKKNQNQQQMTRKGSGLMMSAADVQESEQVSDAKGSSDSNTDRSSMESNKSDSDPKDSHSVTVSDELTTSSRKISSLDPDFHFFSDTELTTNQGNSRPSSPAHITSDTEFEVQKSKEESLEQSSQSWAWGEFPKNISTSTSLEIPKAAADQEEHNSMLSNVFSFMKQNKHGQTSAANEGIYLSDINSIDPQTASRYFSSFHSYKQQNIDADMDCESGNGPSLAQSPNSAEGAKSIDSEFDEQDKILQSYYHNISISMCGWEPAPTSERFLQHVIPFSDLCNDPTLFESENLVVRIKEKYYTWKVAAPIMSSLLIYQRPLPQSSVDQLVNVHMPTVNAVCVSPEKEQQQKPENRSWMWMWRRSRSSRETTPGPESADKTVAKAIDIPKAASPLKEKTKEDFIDDYRTAASASVDIDYDTPTKKKVQSDSPASFPEKCRKTLRLSSEQIANLDLLDGMNEVEFSVTTAYQGTTRCKCNLYKWRWDDKIVISDIDGTITKSDVLGHILPIVGADWAQTGVAQLFNKIKNNGYKMMYLSARAIGQARTTREYLKSIKQEDVTMPDGPILLNPTSLITAFHREVIEKKPEQFKISCMSDIKALFPVDSNPFYAGYGNRINDVWAYTAVGIPIIRIFTINSRGELKHELTQTFQSSYSSQSVVVNDVFPPYQCTAPKNCRQYSDAEDVDASSELSDYSDNE